MTHSWQPVLMPKPIEIHDVDGHVVAEYECKNLPPRNRVFVRRAYMLDHYLGAERVQKQAWFTDNSMSDTMVMENINVRNNGGLVLVMTLTKNAHKAENIVGFAFSWAATADRKGPTDTYIFSNLVGVLPSHQGNNFATIMKAEQRRRYLDWWDSSEFSGRWTENPQMVWTVYPVLCGNHHLNFDCLGAHCKAFYPNLYGPIEGGLYGGLPTDRLEMTWDLKNPRTLQLNAEPDSLLNWTEEKPTLTSIARAGKFAKGQIYKASFPSKFQDLKMDDFSLAKLWQQTIGEVIEMMTSSGFHVAGFKRGKEFGNFIFLANES